VAKAGHLLFVWRATGYELLERPGDPPPVGSEVDLDEEGGGTFFVSKLGSSPLPRDPRPCAFLLAA
jgi:hypothetical protein